MTPQVSILIPCRNGEAFLRETLCSALNQTLAPVEVIVVDDGSTDRSAEIAREFGPLVRVIPNVGRGVSAARTYAGTQARGDAFQFLDADDLLEPHALQSRVDALEAESADLVISDWERLSTTGTGGEWTVLRRESGRLPTATEPGDLAVLRGFWAPPAAILYRRSVCERVGPWKETLPVIQDARFLFDALHVGGRLAHVGGVGARYRQHQSNSISTRSVQALWWDILRNAVDVEGMWKSDGRLDPVHRSALADLYAGCARIGFTSDQQLFDAASQHLRRFPDSGAPKFVKTAWRLRSVLGYKAARWVMCGSAPTPGGRRPQW